MLQIKTLILNFFSFINIICLRLLVRVRSNRSVVYFLRVKSRNVSNILSLQDLLIKYGFFNIDGFNNVVKLKGKHAHLKISIIGNNNCLILEDQSQSLNAEIIIRGNDCKVFIGKGTTFGNHIYMVCMGNNNSITIGEKNMFADNVDIWNTDSHPIYNSDKVLINASMPITIGTHNWFGKYVKILKGTNVGDDSVIGIASVITGQQISSNTLNVGTPTRCIRENISWERSFINK